MNSLLLVSAFAMQCVKLSFFLLYCLDINRPIIIKPLFVQYYSISRYRKLFFSRTHDYILDTIIIDNWSVFLKQHTSCIGHAHAHTKYIDIKNALF